jgi:3(or 17)beta-hydroxysteroid dehydrogenase
MGTPDDIAKGIVFLASDDAAFMTGAGLVIDGGITAQ